MTAEPRVAKLPPSTPGEAEWQRLELLCHFLAESRRGREPDGGELERLRRLQADIERERIAGSLSGVDGGSAVARPLSILEGDLLVAAVAPEAEPRFGWIFQSLQPGTPQPYPTPALLQEILALDAATAQPLFDALQPAAPLVRDGLVQIEGSGPYALVKPGPGVTARLLGRPQVDSAPPGATPVAISPSWSELVLPADRLGMLREFLFWVRHRRKVFDEWGGRDCGGPVALFSGPSGTGKTFAAAVLATDLGWPAYRVDLGRLVSKYIGETEKNLNRLFDAAHDRPMVLQFDEADSLFSKRGEVKEARDRYANMEVSHLLARIESHRGPCILTTNLRQNLDQAFARRFQVVVDFPRPDAEARAELWRRLLPPRAPLTPAVDVAFLGAAVSLTGGGIRNAALHAAFLAAEREAAIGLTEITLGIWRELSKTGRELAPDDLGELAVHLPRGEAG